MDTLDDILFEIFNDNLSLEPEDGSYDDAFGVVRRFDVEAVADDKAIAAELGAIQIAIPGECVEVEGPGLLVDFGCPVGQLRPGETFRFRWTKEEVLWDGDPNDGPTPAHLRHIPNTLTQEFIEILRLEEIEGTWDDEHQTFNATVRLTLLDVELL